MIGSFAAIGGFLFGYHTAVISGVATMHDFISKFGGADSERQGKLASVVNGGIVASLLLGCVFGALIAGRVSDLLSRKYSIVISSIIFIISGILQVFSVDLAMLIVARFIAGKF
jgi:SP family sugar:H+ symporter-like MFS transporter